MSLRNNLKFSLLDACFFSIMVGLGETYLSAFVLALNYSELASGLIATVPMLAGGIFQLFCPWALKKNKSFKTWVVSLVAIQGLIFFPLAVCAFLGKAPIELIFILVMFYWAIGMACGPAWNMWLNSLVPDRIRITFFSKRSLFLYLCNFSALVAAGLILNASKAYQKELLGFFIIFLLAGLFRLVSAYSLSKHTDGEKGTEVITIVPYRKLLSRLRCDGHGKILRYLVFFQFAVYFSAPYFNPYMLAKLHMPYWVYMLMLAILIFGKVVMMFLTPYLGRLFKIEHLIFFSSVGIAIFPLFWILSENFLYLVFLQLLCGMVWGMYELCVFLVLFNKIPEQEKTSILSGYSFLQTLSLVAGSVCGGLLLKIIGEYKETYIWIFIISGFLRMACLFAFPGAWRRLKQQRQNLFS